jgi:polysaccharide deacetylase family protein (PEP-CTERM system associated)
VDGNGVTRGNGAAGGGPPESLLLSFDVEDWHQIVHRRLGDDGWDRPGEAFERQMRSIFDLLDELGVNATFFLLGMTVRHYPDLVREIVRRGDEVACHGYDHERVFRQTPDEFRADLERSVELIEGTAGRRPLGYRAPAFSINRTTPWAYEVLAELGFRYDSSQYDSPRVPDRIQPVPSTPYRLELPSGRTLWEYPITTLDVGGRALPMGGGGYWRILPAGVLARGFRRLGELNTHPVLYFHPYECDPEPLHTDLSAPPSPRQRVGSVLRYLKANPGRRLIVPRIQRIARDFELRSYEQAHAQIDERYGACTRSLSQEGVLV